MLVHSDFVNYSFEKMHEQFWGPFKRFSIFLNCVFILDFVAVSGGLQQSTDAMVSQISVTGKSICC